MTDYTRTSQNLNYPWHVTTGHGSGRVRNQKKPFNKKGMKGGFITEWEEQESGRRGVL